MEPNQSISYIKTRSFDQERKNFAKQLGAINQIWQSQKGKKNKTNTSQ